MVTGILGGGVVPRDTSSNGCFSIVLSVFKEAVALENQTVETLKKMAFLERGFFQLQRFLVDFVVSSP